MKAIICEKFGTIEELIWGELPDPVIEKGKILIGVKACGVNFPDGLMVQGKYQTKPPFPFSAGSEAAGVVLDLDKDLTGFALGERVFAGTGYGSFAEKVLADVHRVIPIPAELDFTEVAGITTTFGTAYHALVDRANLQKNETLLVTGASGGVGLAAIQIGKFLGAKVIAVASSPEKRIFCQQYGADEVLDYETENWKERISQLTDKQGINVVLDNVGGVCAEPLARNMAWRGRYLVVGFTSGQIPQIPFNLPLLKGFSIVGVFFSSFAKIEKEKYRQNMQTIAQLLAKKQIRQAIYEVLPLQNAVQALQKIANREVLGKIVLET